MALLLTPCAKGVESFELAKLGAFTTLATEYGQLSADSGTAEIINSGKTGKQSLRILGGENKSLTLALKTPPSVDVPVRMWSERWSRENPFQFIIKAVGPFGEKEIYKGDKINVGGFNTRIEATVPAKTKELQFIASTAEGKGLKIDDLAIFPVIPMKVDKTSIEANVYPVIIRQEFNPVLRWDIAAEGVLKPISVSEVHLDLTGTTNLKDIKRIDFVQGAADPTDGPGKSAQSEPEHKISTSGDISSNKVVIKGNLKLEPGDNHCWVSVVLKDKADIDGKIVVKPVGLIAGKATHKAPSSEPVTQRIGYLLAGHGDFNSKFYRIPGLARTKKGTLIGVFDIRYDHQGDLPANIKVGARRSTDGGKTWSDFEIAMDDKKVDPKYADAKGIGDPAILVDEKTGRIWVAAIWSYRHSIWGSKSGDNSPEACGQLVLTYSDDDGKTWAKQINITDQTKQLGWKILFNGPGCGICMKDGTLVFPAQYWDEKGVPWSTIVYSKDNGKTWACGLGVHEQTTEAQVIELDDGSIMINARCNWGGSRVVGVTKDLGKTWEMHPTNRSALREPVCQAALIKTQVNGKNAVLYSNPDTTSGRYNMTIKASKDDAKTWPEKLQLLYDSRTSPGYSSMAPADDQHIGILYEGPHCVLFYMRLPYKDFLK